MYRKKMKAEAPRVAQSMVALALVAMALAGPAALARSSDRQQEAEIDAGHWLDDPAAGYQVFSKGVTLVQGTLEITAEKATVYRGEDGGFSRIVLEGEPARWQEEMDDGGRLSAQARVIDYDVGENQVLLKEQAVVNKERDEISGELIRYDLTTQKLDAGSDGDSRVRIRFTPQKKQDQPD